MTARERTATLDALDVLHVWDGRVSKDQWTARRRGSTREATDQAWTRLRARLRALGWLPERDQAEAAVVDVREHARAIRAAVARLDALLGRCPPLA